MKKRVYRSEARGAQAAHTRIQILAAAKQLFKKVGFDRVTISLLAETAGVSMPTIYATFKSKRGVLQALIDSALPTEQFTELVDLSMKEKSPKQRLRTTAMLARQMYDAEQELMDMMRGASVVSFELKELEQEREWRRHERQKEYVSTFIRDKALAQGLTLETARDVLWALTGRDLYRMLVIERGWTPDEYETWLGQLLIESLLGTDVK